LDTFSPHRREVEPADPANFTGSATLVRMTGVLASPQVNAYLVRFEPGARTAWHQHSGPQLLIVTEGRCRVQKRGEPTQDVAAGDIVAIRAGEVHWHGAAPGTRAAHLALNLDATTTWLEKVTDAEYAGAGAP
jgi:quercetin dioxygenase-like cupin family protein